MRIAVILALLAVCSLPALAQGDSAPGRKDQLVMSTRTFLNAHPDLKHRNEGWIAFQAGDHATALKNFLIASRHADKPS